MINNSSSNAPKFKVWRSTDIARQFHTWAFLFSNTNNIPSFAPRPPIWFKSVFVVYLSKWNTPYPQDMPPARCWDHSQARHYCSLSTRGQSPIWSATMETSFYYKVRLILRRMGLVEMVALLKNLSLNPSPVSNPSMLCFSFSCMQCLCKSYLRLVIYYICSETKKHGYTLSWKIIVQILHLY